MRNAIPKCVAALFFAGFAIGEAPAHGPRLVRAETAALSAAACDGPAHSALEIDPFRTSARPPGVTLAQACESPRCPPGQIPCNYQIRPNGCVAWRCCIGR
jgi:hypothetical protein